MHKYCTHIVDIRRKCVIHVISRKVTVILSCTNGIKSNTSAVAIHKMEHLKIKMDIAHKNIYERQLKFSRMKLYLEVFEE